MKRLKRGIKKASILLVAALMLTTCSAFAATEDVTINSIAIENGLAEIKVQNHLERETLLTITVIKEDNTLSLRDKVYGVRQRTVKAGEETSFFVEIPEEKRGVSGTGSYIVEIRNSGDGYAKENFLYASAKYIDAFALELKAAAGQVTDAALAYEKLLPIVSNLQNRTIMISLGIDYDAFVGESTAVQQAAMNFLYGCQLGTMTEKEICEALGNSYLLAVYNTGVKKQALKAFVPMYFGVKADIVTAGLILDKMDASYSTVAAFDDAFTVNYGLETINTATVDTMADVLAVFYAETGECGEKINQIQSLQPLKAYKAYEYIVNTLQKTKLKSPQQLTGILAAGYQNATAGSGGVGTGGGDGASGGVKNQAPINGGSVSVPIGAETADTPVDTSKRIFTDLPIGHWAEESIKALKTKGIVNGTLEGAYEPERAVTREEFTKMLVLACEFTAEGDTTNFIDVDDNAWYAPYICAAVEHGIVNGISETFFGVGQNISRQDMAVMIKRALEKKSVTLSKVRDYNEFLDYREIAEYARTDVMALYEAGVVNGKGENEFDPVGAATRAEVAKIIYEALKGEM